jgi:hypothetical protein
MMATAVGMGSAVLPPVSFGSSGPLIGGTSAEVSQNNATLEARIRPSGLETTYELWLEYPVCSSGNTCEAATRERVGEGFIPAGVLEEVVSAELTSLNWSYFFNFVVIASNSDGTIQSYPLTFTTGSPLPPGNPEGSGTGTPVERSSETWFTESAEPEAHEAPRFEEEREAKTKEDERPATEVGEETPSSCVVPRLKGDSVRAARRALAKDHCILGKVSEPRTHRGALVVMTQSTKAGLKLANGAAVAVKLGPPGQIRKR